MMIVELLTGPFAGFFGLLGMFAAFSVVAALFWGVTVLLDWCDRPLRRGR